MSPSTPYAREPGLPGDGGGGWGREAVVRASTFEVGSVGPASREEAHPAISIAIAVTAIREGYKRLGLLVMGGSRDRAPGLISFLTSFDDEDVEEGGLRTAGRPSGRADQSAS
jgi:hypothetical protein